MRKREKLSKYGALLGGYGVGVFLNQSINLILIPVFWRVLSPEDFGIIAVTQIIALFLTPVYMFGASETIQRFYYKWSDDERPHYLSWFFWFIFAFTLVLTLVMDFLGARYSKYIIVNVPFDPLLRYTLWSTFFINFINFPIAISRIKQKVFSYNVLMNGSFLTQIGIVYYLVKIENQGAHGYIKGYWLANLLWFLPCVFMTFKDAVIIPSKKHFKIPLDYAAPLSFAGIVEGFGSILDRYFLDKFVPLATMGFYDLARKFGSLVNIINAVTKLIFIPYIYKMNAIKNNAAHILSNFSLVYSVMMTIPVIAVCTIGNEVVSLLDPSGVYLKLVEYIPAFALSFYFVSLATIMGRGMDLAGVTKWSFMVPLFGILVSLGAYLTLLPEYGVWGVLLGMVLGSFARNLVNILLALVYFPRELFPGKLISAWLLSAGFYAGISILEVDNVWLSAMIKAALILLLAGIQIKLVLYKNLMNILEPARAEKDAV